MFLKRKKKCIDTSFQILKSSFNIKKIAKQLHYDSKFVIDRVGEETLLYLSIMLVNTRAFQREEDGNTQFKNNNEIKVL